MKGGQGSDDTVWLVLAGVLFAPALIAGIGANVLAPVRIWLVERQVLVADAVIIPIGAGAGLDLVRIVLIAGLVALVITLAVLIAVRRRRRLEVENR